MSYATAAPGQQAGTAGSCPPSCQNCQTSTTPLWRRDESGAVLCNACGLFLKLHGRARPSSLKTDVIKSRNRVKALSHGKQLPKKDTINGHGLAAAHPDLSASPGSRPSFGHSLPSDSVLHTGLSLTNDCHPVFQAHDRDTDGLNIAPQHLFDGATLDGAASETNGFTHQSRYVLKRPGSPTTLSPINGSGIDTIPSDSCTDLRVLVSSNTTLKTRVSELEVINELFRGRVNELESTESDTQRRLDDALRREQDLRSKLTELEALLLAAAASTAEVEAHSAKRVKTDDVFLATRSELSKAAESEAHTAISHLNADLHVDECAA